MKYTADNIIGLQFSLVPGTSKWKITYIENSFVYQQSLKNSASDCNPLEDALEFLNNGHWVVIPKSEPNYSIF